MELYGVKLSDAGKKIKQDKLGIETTPPDEKPTMRYETLYSSTDLMPVPIEDFKAGDKVVLVAVCNVAERTIVDRESVKGSEEHTRFQLEFLKVGMKAYVKKKADEMTDGEIEDEVKGSTKGRKQYDG